MEREEFTDFSSQEEDLSDTTLTLAASKLSEAAFSKIWDNPEDAEYDKL
jgi:hypothetical protein